MWWKIMVPISNMVWHFTIGSAVWMLELFEKVVKIGKVCLLIFVWKVGKYTDTIHIIIYKAIYTTKVAITREATKYIQSVLLRLIRLRGWGISITEPDSDSVRKGLWRYGVSINAPTIHSVFKLVQLGLFSMLFPRKLGQACTAHNPPVKQVSSRL